MDAFLSRLKGPFLTLTFLYIAVVLLFRETLAYGFFQDDFWYLAHVKSAGFTEALKGKVFGYYRPLAMSWLPWINQRLWGSNPAGFYLHMYLWLAVLLYYLLLLLRRITGSTTVAWWGVALYAGCFVLPYNLGWPVTGNMEILATLGVVGGAWWFLLFLETGRRRHMAAALLFVFAGITSKEFVFFIPALFAVCWLLFTPERTVRSFLRAMLPPVIVTTGWMVLSMLRFPGLWRTGRFFPEYVPAVIAGAFDALMPVPLRGAGAAAVGVIIVALAAVLAYLDRPKGFGRMALLACALIIVPAVPSWFAKFVSPYYSTAPAAGVTALFCLIVQGVRLSLASSRLPRAIAQGALALAMGAFLAGEYRRSIEARPYQSTIAGQPMTQRLLSNIGYWLGLPENRNVRTVGFVGMTEQHVWCLGTMDAFPYLFPQIQVVNPVMKRPPGTIIDGGEAAAAQAQLVLYVDGDGHVYRERPRNPAELSRRATELLNQARYAEALPLFAELAARPAASAADRYHYAFCLHMTGKVAQAEEWYALALERNDAQLEPWIRYNRGGLYLNAGRLDEAETDLRRARALDPANQGIVTYLRALEERRRKGR